MAKLAQLVNPEFQGALGELMQKEIPVRTSFKLKSLLKRLGEEVKTYNEVRTELLNKFGDKDEDGKLAVDEKNSVKFSGDNLKNFGEAMSELLKMDVDIGSISAFELGEKISISTNSLALLDGVITE